MKKNPTYDNNLSPPFNRIPCRPCVERAIQPWIFFQKIQSDCYSLDDSGEEPSLMIVMIQEEGQCPVVFKWCLLFFTYIYILLHEGREIRKNNWQVQIKYIIYLYIFNWESRGHHNLVGLFLKSWNQSEDRSKRLLYRGLSWRLLRNWFSFNHTHSYPVRWLGMKLCVQFNKTD